MPVGPVRPVRILLGTLAVLAVVAGAVWFSPLRRHIPGQTTTADSKSAEPPAPALPEVNLVPGQLNRMSVPEDVIQLMHIQTCEVIVAPPPEPLRLDGSLFLDANSLVHSRTRFAGEVVELGLRDEAAASDDSTRRNEPSYLRFGDRVKKGQLLAVVWSKDLGEKKSEFAQAIAEMRLDQEQFKRLEELWRKGASPEAKVRSAEREVESDLIAIAKAERTLRSWRLTNEEIDAIRAESEEIHQRKGQWDKSLEASWARVEIRSPINGTILEKNAVIGDYVSVDLDLFKIADLSRLDVLAHVYEDDLSELEALAPEQRRWTITLKADPHAAPLVGSFHQIGNIIDPSQHTALVMGWVDNTGGRLRIGQFVTASIEIPADPDEVAVPVTALVDQDGRDVIFVAHGAHEREFECRTVEPTRRRDKLVYLRSRPAQDSTASAPPLTPQDWVVTSGGIELTAKLQSLQAAQSLGQKDLTSLDAQRGAAPEVKPN